MELVGLVSVAVMPWIVKTATGALKQIKPLPVIEYRVLIIRALVAVLSLAGAVLSVWVGDLNEIDGALVETAVLAVFNAVVATWLYMRQK